MVLNSKRHHNHTNQILTIKMYAHGHISCFRDMNCVTELHFPPFLRGAVKDHETV
jgi:hypothetical protein